MELDELKNIWKNNDPQFQPKDEAEIASMLHRRSLSIIDKLKRNVLLELIFTVVISIVLLIYGLTLPSGRLKWISVTILITFLAYSVFYIKKLVFLSRFNPATENVRGNLLALHDNMTGYVKFYRRSYTILYPIVFSLSLVFKGIEQGAEKLFETISRPGTIINLVLLAAVYYFLSTWFANWFLKKLYGNHLEKLKGMLNDIHG